MASLNGTQGHANVLLAVSQCHLGPPRVGGVPEKLMIEAVTSDGEVVATSAAPCQPSAQGAFYAWQGPHASLALPVTFFLDAKGGYRENFINVRAVEPSTGAVVSQCAVDLSQHVKPGQLQGEMKLTLDANSDLMDDMSLNDRCAPGTLQARFSLALVEAVEEALVDSMSHLEPGTHFTSHRNADERDCNADGTLCVWVAGTQQRIYKELAERLQDPTAVRTGRDRSQSLYM